MGGSERLLSPTGGLGNRFFEVAEEIKRSTRRGGAQFLIALCASSDICAHHYTAFLILLRHGCKRIYSKARGKFVEADALLLFSSPAFTICSSKRRGSRPRPWLLCISSRKMHSQRENKKWPLFFLSLSTWSFE